MQLVKKLHVAIEIQSMLKVFACVNKKQCQEA